jgi:hypothetical protein
VPEPDPRALKTSDAPEENCAPNIQNQNSPRRAYRADPRSARAHPARDRAGGGHRELSRHRRGAGRSDTAQPVEASWRSCGGLGSLRALGPGLPAVWARTGGAQRAADRRNAELPPGHRYRVGSPARCLAGMVRRAGSAGVNLAGLFRATERNARHAAASPAPETPSSSRLAHWPISPRG